MKLSVSLPDKDVISLDEYVRAQGLPSRSAAVHCAIQMLRTPELEHDYATAWQEWEASGEESAWAAAGADGLADAPR